LPLTLIQPQKSASFTPPAVCFRLCLLLCEELEHETRKVNAILCSDFN
jgi:hypothetical protein